ncbi:MAG: hypothetical protein A2X86_10815 [Bdellovibrionales bacterium GWA2_49_15]|nr:MAG: hypothetical protein A2X86_10815 [Bdellovibrionales bacterium GWA2_49_15]HAZ11466.1 ABC transporter permease [Bdellovibrionales bacterium]
MKERSRPRPPLIVFFISAMVLILLYLPLLVVWVNSLLENVDARWILSLRWYREVFSDSELMAAMERSLLVGLSASFFATILGTGAAIAVSKEYNRFRLRHGLEIMSFISLIIPELVFALSLLMWFFILKIPLGLGTVITAHTTFCLSFVMLTVGARVSALDPALEDAARDLGASEFRILFKVTLPLLLPAIVAAFVLCFLLSFDDFLITFYTNGVGSDTLPMRLYGAIKMGITPKLSAMSTIMFLFTVGPILLIFKGRALRDLV